ncbi:ADP-ribosylglycohydrolase family protein [Chryseobacterium sp. NKUCC03_KSP]|uniref:ADP-ribosylglycohydrolase family protein n=1 Tax=Chryseobacterium sp. NKUCC03_KSP TaxID=2842125 RepID=UPI001C5A93DE|nr:ADP-ribosylglycohydrolase family protein [Chryseobacterium sp. NKUCC03_KSP]MBW3524863.1 ADP-ribosylglycohydrolase family protein [Chryseobacterium sp. NKUCC03_KSP]
MENIVKAGIFGVCIGDALGVPVEFRSRDQLKRSPVTTMRAFGTHRQPAGTWSDDSSLMLCLADSLCKRYDLEDIALKFLQWYNAEVWTPHGSVFDIGIATSQAIHRISKGTSPTLCGGTSEFDNGNGSLMRILPLSFYIKDFPIVNRFDVVKDVSSITHGHIRSVLACFIYLEFALEILKEKDKWEAYKAMQKTVREFLDNDPICSQEEMDKFHRILELKVGEYDIAPLHTLEEDEISSSGYVLHSLEASLWCFLNSESYSEAVLKAVNLGEDTDTTGAITGGIAGIYYGFENIPDEWVSELVRKKDIEELCIKLGNKLMK